MTITIELGGNIQLTGFSGCDPATMIVVKKMVGNFVRNLSSSDCVSGLHITLKEIPHEKSNLYEFHAHLHSGKQYAAEIVSRNLMVGLDAVMKKVEHAMHTIHS